VTICTKDQKCYFGNIVNGKMMLSGIGLAAKGCWFEIPEHFPFTMTDEFVVMPNHVHGIVIINENSQQQKRNVFGPQPKNLPSIIRGYKIGVKKYATTHNLLFHWQSRFYEHIIRNEESLGKIRNYILSNPERWDLDKYNTNKIW